ncbi:unnamed protein product [Agarophyton chilense]
MTKKPLRIACLHGYCQNSLSFRRKTGSLRKSLTRSTERVRADLSSSPFTPADDNSPLCELVYLDAPFVVEQHLTAPATPLSYKDPNSDNYAVLRPTNIRFQATYGSPESAPRAWWIADRQRTTYIGLNHTISYLADVFKESHFDGVLGFSQGAVLASILCAVREQPAFESLQFALLFSGFQSRATVHQPFYEKSIKVPSFHVWGEQDGIVPPKRSEELKDKFERQTRSHYVHQKGHLVPSDAGVRRAVSRFLLPFSYKINELQVSATL